MGKCIKIPLRPDATEANRVKGVREKNLRG